MSERFFSERFQRNVWLTNHAIEATAKRGMTLPELKALLAHGEFKSKDARHGWVYHELSGRDDNLVCAAVVVEEAIIVETVMVRWQVR